MDSIQSAGIIVFYMNDREPEYLLLHYPSGHWEFAKGKLEFGETKEQAAVRELKEETGLELQIIPGFEETFSYFFNNKQHELVLKKVYFFAGQSHEKKVIVSEEHQGYRWLPYEQALELLTYQNAREVFKKAHNFIMATFQSN